MWDFVYFYCSIDKSWWNIRKEDDESNESSSVSLEMLSSQVGDGYFNFSVCFWNGLPFYLL